MINEFVKCELIDFSLNKDFALNVFNGLRFNDEHKKNDFMKKFEVLKENEKNFNLQDFLDILNYDDFSFNRDIPVDFRNADLSKLDFIRHKKLLEMCCFSTLTKFPTDDKMPDGFKEKDRKRIMENGKYRKEKDELKSMGITGKGVKVAIIDQNFNINHPEINSHSSKNHYEAIKNFQEPHSSFHGILVSSILKGKTTGIAPDVDLYYFAADFRNDEKDQEKDLDKLNQYECSYKNQIKALDKILLLNQAIKNKEDQIRIVSVSYSLINYKANPRFASRQDNKGVVKYHEEMQQKLQEMKDNGITVINPALNTYLNLKTIDGKQVLENKGYEKAIKLNNQKDNHKDMILFPNVPLTTGGFFVSNDSLEQYETRVTRVGLSSPTPYIAGLFALSRQVDPDIEFDDFCDTLRKTGTDIKYPDETGKEVNWGKAINSVNAIKQVIENKKSKSAEKNTSQNTSHNLSI